MPKIVPLARRKGEGQTRFEGAPEEWGAPRSGELDGDGGGVYAKSIRVTHETHHIVRKALPASVCRRMKGYLWRERRELGETFKARGLNPSGAHTSSYTCRRCV